MTADSVWRRFLRSVGVHRFQPPRVAGHAQARAVREALTAFLDRSEDRFRRLFLHGEALAPENDERLWMHVLAAAGYVKEVFGIAIWPCVRVFFFDGLFIATDRLTRDDEDQVFSLMMEQVFFVRSMVVRKGDHVLDLCLGSGVNALTAVRRGAARVVGVDTSARALAFAAVNAAVNRSREHRDVFLETMRGNLFEPIIGGDRFDLIVANPPFELTPPEARHLHQPRGGVDGLGIVRALLPRIPERLSPEGRFEMYTRSPGGEAWERVTELVHATFPEFCIEVRRVDGLPLDSRIAHFRDHPGYAAWRSRLALQRVSHVWGVHIRAHRGGPPDSCGSMPRVTFMRATRRSQVGNRDRRSERAASGFRRAAHFRKPCAGFLTHASLADKSADQDDAFGRR